MHDSRQSARLRGYYMVKVNIRYALKTHYAAMVEMDTSVLSMGELVKELQDKNTTAITAIWKDTVVGYAIYTINKDHVEIIGFMVHPDYRYNGVGSEMMASLVTKFEAKKPLKIQVHESNLDFHLFLKIMGFKATYNRGEDYYTFTYTPAACHA